MKPLISYYGGKQRIATQILPLFPPHTVYVEPFCGGAALLFAKPKPFQRNGDDYREVINDINKRLYKLYKVAREQPEELQRRIALTLYSQADHQLSKLILSSSEQYTDMDVAWAFYVKISQSFANDLGAGWGTSVLGKNHAKTWESKKRSLPLALERLSEVYISCEDALSCIKRWDSPQTLFYCDPPYPGTNQGHYAGYTTSDFEALIDVLSEIQGACVLSNYDSDYVPASWEKHEIDAFCSSSGKGQVGTDRSRASTATELGDRRRTEVVWVKHRKATLREDVAALINQPTQLHLFN